jgi:O-antigen/teichoic acid export membrane protein
VLFGDSWAGAAAVLLAMGLSSVSSSLANGPAGVLYGLGQARGTFRLNLGKGPVLLLALLVSTPIAGVVGAAWALAAIEAAVLPVWILTLRRTLSRLGEPGQDDDAPTPLDLPIPATPETRDGAHR